MIPQEPAKRNKYSGCAIIYIFSYFVFLCFFWEGGLLCIEGVETWPWAAPLPGWRLAATTAVLRAPSDETLMLPPESAKSDWSIRVGPSGLWSTLGARMRLCVLDWPDGRNARPSTQNVVLLQPSGREHSLPLAGIGSRCDRVAISPHARDADSKQMFHSETVRKQLATSFTLLGAVYLCGA